MPVRTRARGNIGGWRAASGPLTAEAEANTPRLRRLGRGVPARGPRGTFRAGSSHSPCRAGPAGENSPPRALLRFEQNLSAASEYKNKSSFLWHRCGGAVRGSTPEHTCSRQGSHHEMSPIAQPHQDQILGKAPTAVTVTGEEDAGPPEVPLSELPLPTHLCPCPG